MRRLRSAVVATLGLLTVLATGCAGESPTPITGPDARPALGVRDRVDAIRGAIAAHQRHADGLLRVPGVVGTAVGLLPDGRTTLRVLLADDLVRGLPAELDGIPVTTHVTGRIVALSDPTTRQRPAPLGFSVGHPSITAGTIGARVRDGSGNVFVLSNNHVLANGNAASVGDATLQPGPYDGGTAADQIGTLAAFAPITFSGSASNLMDAAIAVTSAANVGNATPSDDGYGAPGSAIHGDANGDGTFDDKTALLGLAVQKYGRTTKLTQGTITGINATITVCYEVLWIFCTKSARFVDQLIIEPGGFSGGGDSGSLIVAADATRNVVGLLFAGSATQTIANRIDLVLAHFGVTIDGAATPPPTPVTDLAVASVAAPASVTQGSTASVTVTVRNAGNQSLGAGTVVTLRDATDGVTIGTQTTPALAPSATATLGFSWNTTGSSLGTHTLTASHGLADDDAGNDQASTTSTVTAPQPVTGMHIGDLDGWASSSGTRWSATVEITVHDANHNPINGATVVGSWNVSGLASNTCTTGDLGGNGTCIVLFPDLRRSRTSVIFTVNSVTMAGATYQSGANHDPDGSSNGTWIRVNRP